MKNQILHPSKRHIYTLQLLTLVLALGLGVPAIHAATTTIIPSMDNTMAVDFPDNSSGACDSIFAGSTDNGFARRALLQFDMNSIPAGSTINSATLTMTVTRDGNHPDATMSLHLVQSAWLEGTNGCGVRGGGQGEAANVGAAGNSDMVVDIQAWLDDPAINFGWVLIGDEATFPSTRRFDSREGVARPSLLVDFTPSGDVGACCQVDGSCALTSVGFCTGTLPPVSSNSCEPNQCPQPFGACCNFDESCSDPQDRLSCETGGGVFQGEASACSENAVDCGLTPFVDALPIPPVLQSTGTRPDGVLQYSV